MFLNNKIILVPNFEELFNILNNKNIEDSPNCKFIYEKQIAIQHISKNISNTIQIWNTYSLFDWWYDKYENCGRNFIAKIEFTIYDTFIKINHLNINDGTTNLYNNPLDEDDAEDLINELIKYIKLVASENCKNKIIIDVHENLRLFEKYYYNLDFELTNRKSKYNPYWIEAELNF